jgi:hypothetical protein
MEPTLAVYEIFPATFGCIYTYIYTQSVPRGKVNIPRGHSIGHSKQKVYMNMYPIPNVNRKICDKKEILRVRTVSNTSIYCSSDRVGTVYNKCSKILPSTSMQVTLHTDSRASDSGAAGREGRTILGAKAKSLYSQWLYLRNRSK